ncbi:MAG: hypothetical protein IRZ32_18640, partial [Solirubrobacteraceae bacterium]|nr:hypothetical protein [Solirubrobacteraceae bacterium]
AAGPDAPSAPVAPAAPAAPARRPALSVRVPGGQRVARRGLAVAATATVPGTLRASGRLRVGGRAIRLTPASASATADRAVTLRLRPGPRGRALLRRAARPARAEVTVVLVAADGTRVSARRTVRVR